jgi:hypothetical protein
MNVFLFTYKVTYYDSIEDDYGKAKGVVVAEDYKDAISKLEYMYGEFQGGGDDFIKDLSLHYYQNEYNDGTGVYPDLKLPEDEDE